MKYDVLIVGAGPAGLFAACQAAAKGAKALILEKQPDPGRKLLLTGSGQCNFTNIRPIPEFLSAYGVHGLFLKPALFHFTNQDSMAFFQKQGVESMVVESTGKVFPQSQKAQDILTALLSACGQFQVEIKFQEKVAKIESQGKHVFRFFSNSGAFEAKNVILATGGKSYPATGSTGDGYALAQSLGHSLVAPRPGLAPFVIKHFSLADLAGTSFQGLAVTLWQGNKKLKTLSDDLVITHQGISGPVVQNLARDARPGQKVTLAFVPYKNQDDFKRVWLDRMEKSGKLGLRIWLKAYPLTQALAQKLMSLAKVKPDDAVARLSREKRLALFDLATAFPMEIEAIGDFSTAMVTCGGVDLKDVNSKTMESRLVPGLYFVGEVLDIDGDCGGYDLQAAWSTAALAAHSLKI